MDPIRSESILQPLKKGDEVLAISISSPIMNNSDLLEGLEVFKGWGLTCKNRVEAGRHWGYLSAEDSHRFSKLHPKTSSDLTAFARGGWGAARLLESPQPWKKGWMLGYSDLSSILLARLSAGFDGGVHGPLITSISKEPQWSKERVKSILFKKSAPDIHGETWCKGIAKGPLIASNLTVATHLLGSKYMPNLQGAILVLEDIGEAPYRIDRMLTHWRLTGALQKVAGLAFGQFINCIDKTEENSFQSFTTEEVLKERTRDLNIPIIGNLPIGHCSGNAALPLGWDATLDGNQGILNVQTSKK